MRLQRRVTFRIGPGRFEPSINVARGSAFMRHSARFTTIGVVAACLLALGACKRQPPTPYAAAPMAPAAMRSMAVGQAPDATNRRVAYTENFVVELPSEAVEATQQETLKKCLAAGCTILNTGLDRLRNGAVEGSIAVRIAPDRYQAFADTIVAPPARLVSHAETAEDKTIPLLDLEKRLNAQTALRDRLQKMLEQAGTSVGDLVAVEKQLAEVQGTIESETAQRDYLRTITDTVRVDVSYNGLIQQAGPINISPIRAALDTFVQTVIESCGDMIGWVA